MESARRRRGVVTPAAGQVVLVPFPGKLFTANQDLMVTQVGSLRAEARDRILEAVAKILGVDRSR